MHVQSHLIPREVDQTHRIVRTEHRSARAVGRRGESSERSAQAREEAPVRRVELPRDEDALAPGRVQVRAVRGEGERAQPLRMPVALRGAQRATSAPVDAPEADAPAVVARGGERLGGREGEASHLAPLVDVHERPRRHVMQPEHLAAQRADHRRSAAAPAHGERCRATRLEEEGGRRGPRARRGAETGAHRRAAAAAARRGGAHHRHALVLLLGAFNRWASGG